MDIYYLTQFLWVRNTGTTQLGVLAWESLRKLQSAQPPEGLTGAETLLAWLASSSWLLVGGLNHLPQRAQGCLSVLTAWQPASPRARDLTERIKSQHLSRPSIGDHMQSFLIAYWLPGQPYSLWGGLGASALPHLASCLSRMPGSKDHWGPSWEPATRAGQRTGEIFLPS